MYRFEYLIRSLWWGWWLMVGLVLGLVVGAVRRGGGTVARWHGGTGRWHGYGGGMCAVRWWHVCGETGRWHSGTVARWHGAVAREPKSKLLRCSSWR